MKLSLFDYNLPKNRIANKPASPRDSSKLLVYNKINDRIVHDSFLNLPKYLTQNDVLVFNNTKVLPARLLGNKESGGRAEILLLKQINDSEWEAMLGTRKPKIGLKLLFKHNLQASLVNQLSNKTWTVKFNFSDSKLFNIIHKIGQVPLPPYIESTQSQKNLKKQYQTIFAKTEGSSAAPTASLHFTNRLLRKIKKTGCQLEFITLHVGLGTFEPVNTEKIEDFQIHSELIQIDKSTVENLLKAQKQSKRIIAVGTTAVRTLESIFNNPDIPVKNYSTPTNIFIYPGYKFKFVDAIITNFHLPKSSLLILVSAFIGRTKTLALYNRAIKLKYRFFSFGDGIFLINEK